MIEKQRIIDVTRNGEEREQIELADEMLRSDENPATMLESVLDEPDVRKWARSFLLPNLAAERAEELCTSLLRWFEDFRPERRDRTTGKLVETGPDAVVWQNLSLLAGSNAASSLWARLASQGTAVVMQAVTEIFEQGDDRARETTLHLLVLDPYGPEYLSHDLQDQVLTMALNDPDPEIRGLAAEVLAAEKPELLVERWQVAPLDSSERLRMAFWRVALVHHPEDGIEAAGKLALDPGNAHPARRTALIALGENASTREVSPVLQALLRGDDEVLANDAAQLMWRHHRMPDIANAAAESQFTEVANLAQRLLHPEMGSPAAGGSRPGDPTKTTDIFEQMIPPEDRRNQEQ